MMVYMGSGSAWLCLGWMWLSIHIMSIVLLFF